MKISLRQILWSIILIFAIFSLILGAYFLGKQHGIEQVYENELPKIQFFENAEIPLQENILDSNCTFENGVKKCQ